MATNRDESLTIARRAEEVLVDFRQRDRLKDGYTRIDPDLIASGANVVVLYRELQKLLGAFIREENSAGIIVNFDRPRGMVHMTCAHELGHYFLGHGSTADESVEEQDVNSAIEKAANLFAYHLLTPKWLVADLMRRKRLPATRLADANVVYQMSLRLGISYSAMVWQLARLKLIGQTTAGALAGVAPASLKKHALGGKTPAIGKSDVWVIDSSDRDHVLEPGDGDQFVFELPNHLSAGHVWSVDEAASNGFQLKPFLKESEATPRQVNRGVIIGSGSPTTKYELSFPAGTQAPDDGPFERRMLHNLIALKEMRPWTPAEGVLDHVQLETKQEAILKGFSRAEASTRLKKVDPAR